MADDKIFATIVIAPHLPLTTYHLPFKQTYNQDENFVRDEWMMNIEQWREKRPKPFTFYIEMVCSMCEPIVGIDLQQEMNMSHFSFSSR